MNSEVRHIGRPVLVYRDRLGLESETFIYAQTSALSRFVPHFLGSRIDGNLPLGTRRVRTVRRGSIVGKLREAAFKFARFAPDVDAYLEAVEPALIHAHFGPDGAVIGPWAERLGVPLVVTFHGYDVTIHDGYDQVTPTYRLYRRRRDWLRGHGCAFIAVSDFIKEQLLRQGYPEDRVIRHYIGIDVEQFKEDPRIERDRAVLFVGRLVEKKGCRLLIDAMSQVQHVHPDVRLVVIGDGPLRAALTSFAAERRTTVEFLGVQPPAVVRQWMQRALVFSVPSIRATSGDAEGFGMVFAEAAALGTPVASFASGGIPEAVAHGETGLLSPEGDVHGLAHAIVTLLSNANLRARMGSAGAARVRRLFDIRRQTRALEDIYERVLQQSQS